MNNTCVQVPRAHNEPVLDYAPGSSERVALKSELETFLSDHSEIPLIIGGRDVTTGELGSCILPHDHRHQLARYHRGNAETVSQAVAAAAAARPGWSEMAWESRAAIFLKAADLLAGRYRQKLNAATMLNQSKTPHQAEIDAACELIDFWRFNASYLPFIYGQQPESAPGAWNYVEYRALEGFVFAVTPFNFTSVAGNLPTSPALMGNTVVWKPASTAVFSAYWLVKLLEEAGLPPGVINLVPGSGEQIGNIALAHEDLAGVHFTGSTGVFRSMLGVVGTNIAGYKNYPRVVGETGGKNFVFAHPSADLGALVANLVRGAFEYQGQKCSAASRAYIPESLWSRLHDRLRDEVESITFGDVTDFTNFMGAVIDKAAFDKLRQYIDSAKMDSGADVICGGVCDDSKGYFVAPTVIRAHDPYYTTMQTELFGPILTVYVYKDADYANTLDLCDRTSPYALTGAIFAQERTAIELALGRLRQAAGNFYINDKPTGAVVGQQPFGGSRASGTNDKAGSSLNLSRWVSARTIKETFAPVSDYRYPFMGER